jgi:hypothetical protein
VRSLGAALLVGVALTACSSTTSGTGTAQQPRPTRSSVAVSTPASTPSTPTTAAAGTSAAGTVHPAPATPLRTVTVHAPDGATYVIEIWQQVDNPTCFDHAHGQPIVTFLTQHPCTGLRRYLATTTVNGRPVAFAEAATGFAGTPQHPYQDASRFKSLEEADNTGSINDLLSEGYRLPHGLPTSVPDSEAFNVLGQDNGVVVYDAWYLDGPTPAQDPALIKMTQDIFLQF